MNLPELPKQHKKREADFGVYLRHWIKKNPQFKTCAIELKHTRGKNRFNFSELKDEQIAYAMCVSSDQGILTRVRGLSGEADYLYMRNEVAFITIRYPNNVVFITINDYISEKVNSKKKSLSEERACEIATDIIKIRG